ncbi:peptidoglycan DD-metalloendopeptidase family protein (plasmid) [Rhodococcus pseudokoreensis]|uniref:Peptidoglycan DD-metalloendopeptidase family protein n=1 Tax=Rhodococcus pseudokoreensis TaxID=2811421 RepID=A0A974VZ82_9NOCA|nr:peptidoglycan DD-metalloendopeptidase family protein [Rhodococcus pseudokoreensis]
MLVGATSVFAAVQFGAPPPSAADPQETSPTPSALATAVADALTEVADQADPAVTVVDPSLWQTVANITMTSLTDVSQSGGADATTQSRLAECLTAWSAQGRPDGNDALGACAGELISVNINLAQRLLTALAAEQDAPSPEAEQDALSPEAEQDALSPEAEQDALSPEADPALEASTPEASTPEAADPTGEAGDSAAATGESSGETTETTTPSESGTGPESDASEPEIMPEGASRSAQESDPPVPGTPPDGATQDDPESGASGTTTTDVPTTPAPRTWNRPSARGFVAPTSGDVTSTLGDGRQHGGIDIANTLGAPIVAVADGEVISAGPAQGFGLWVRIKHDDGTVTTYGHNNDNLVSVGQRVKAGQRIATIGNRGNSTGPHLHFEVESPTGDEIDPLQWLTARGAAIVGLD